MASPKKETDGVERMGKFYDFTNLWFYDFRCWVGKFNAFEEYKPARRKSGGGANWRLYRLAMYRLTYRYFATRLRCFATSREPEKRTCTWRFRKRGKYGLTILWNYASVALIGDWGGTRRSGVEHCVLSCLAMSGCVCRYLSTRL